MRLGIFKTLSEITHLNLRLFLFQKDTLKLIKNNADLKLTLSQYKLPMALFNTITMENGIRANVRLLLPPTMESGQKYPMIVKIYAGPGSSTVKDAYEMGQYLFIVCFSL